MDLFFPALFDKPTKIFFADLDPDETIELVLRAHFITNLPWILLMVILLILPALSPVLFRLMGFNLFTVAPPRLILCFTIFLYLLIAGFIMERFFSWYFNVYIVTNKHLIDVDFESLLRRNKTEMRLDDIQSLASRTVGIVGPLFNFGTVVISTAANKEEMKFVNIPQPDFVEDRIQILQEGQEHGG